MIRVRDSVVTIYEDRLVANVLIFETLKSVLQKELAVSLSDTTFFKSQNSKINNNLKSLVSRFEQTKLTLEEANAFSDLKKNVQLLLDSESRFLKSDYSDRSSVVNHIEDLKINLNDLSEIQLNEGSRQMSISKRAVDTVELFTQIEIYILAFLAILIQIIIMYKPKEKS